MAPTITQVQKQALIDNLQLEIAERARALRAHYALQCADLRARCERRINRIPLSLRQANMGELFEKHAATAQPKQTLAAHAPPKATKPSSALNHPLPAIPQNKTKLAPTPPSPVKAQSISTQPIRGKKRKSDEIAIASDKENDDHHASSCVSDALPVSKNPKRLKPNPATRTISRNAANSSSVLSPKSHNSRTLPRSPIKDNMTASKIARPASPQKPSSPLKSAATAALSKIARSAKGRVQGPRTISQSSNSSTNTIVKKATTTKAPLKKNVVAANKKVVAEPAAGRRVLRKRA